MPLDEVLFYSQRKERWYPVRSVNESFLKEVVLILKRKWASGSQEEIDGTQTVIIQGFNEDHLHRCGWEVQGNDRGLCNNSWTVTIPRPREEGREKLPASQRRKLCDGCPERTWAAWGNPSGRKQGKNYPDLIFWCPSGLPIGWTHQEDREKDSIAGVHRSASQNTGQGR